MTLSSVDLLRKGLTPGQVPAKRIFVRNSERQMFTDCRQAWEWAYLDQYQPETTPVYFVFGDLIHRALADFYIPETVKRRKRGPHPAKSFVRYYDQIVERGKELGLRIPRNDDRWQEAREMGESMLTNYIELYGDDDQFLVLYPEMPFAVDIFDDDGYYLCTWVGVADAFIYDIQNRMYGLFEHKTTASTIVIDHLFLNEQANAYWTLVPKWLEQNRILKPGQELKFMLYNFLRKAKPDPRPTNDLGQYLNKDGSVSKVQPAPLFMRQPIRRGEFDRQMSYDRIRAQVREMLLVRRGELEVFKSPGDLKCRMCTYKDMCIMHEVGAEWEQYRDMVFVKEDEEHLYRQHAWAL